MKIEKIQTTQKDHRGKITDIVDQIQFNGATIIESKARSTRGNHYHKKSVQYVYILKGKMKCVSKRNGEPLEEAIVYSGHLITHDTFEAHAFEAVEDSCFLVLSSGLRCGKDYEKDTYRLDDPLSEFTIINE